MSKQIGADGQPAGDEAYVNEDHVFVFEDDLGDDFEPPAATSGDVEDTVNALMDAGNNVVIDDQPVAAPTATGEQDTAVVIDPQSATGTPDIETPPAGEVATPPAEPDMEAQLAAMRATLNAQAAEIMQLRANTQAQPQHKPATQPAQSAAVVQPEMATTPRTVDDFVSSLNIDAEALDAIVTSPEGFNGFVKNMLTAYTGFMTPQLVEQVYLSLPAMVTHQIAVQTELNKSVDEFYTSHPVLKEHQNIVAGNIHTIRGEQPEISMNDCLVEAAKRSYVQLGLIQKQAAVTPPATPPNPAGKPPVQKAALPGRTSTRFSGPAGRVTVDPALRQELDEL